MLYAVNYILSNSYPYVFTFEKTLTHASAKLLHCASSAPRPQKSSSACAPAHAMGIYGNQGSFRRVYVLGAIRGLLGATGAY